MAVATPAIFLDRDGTVVRNVPFNADPDKVELMPGAARALRSLWSAGYRLFLASNQSGLARGLFTERELDAVTARLEALLLAEGVRLDGIYVCPHHPDGTVLKWHGPCECRKPMPGMLLQAADEHDIDLGSSWLIGDILDDVEAGKRAGCNAVLLLNGGETEWVPGPYRVPDGVASGLYGAARIILRRLARSEQTAPWEYAV